MLPTTSQENQIISQIALIVFGADIAPSEIKGLRIHDETVVIVTSYALYSLGRDYFRQLVEQIRAGAVVAEAQAEKDLEQDLEQKATAIVAVGQHTKMARLTLKAVKAKAEAKGWSVEKRLGGYVTSNKLTPWGEFNGWYKTLAAVCKAIEVAEPCNPTMEEIVKSGHFN